MKIGDLVKCKNANGLLGVIVNIIEQGTLSFYFVVIGNGNRWPFLAGQLELASKTKNENGNSK